MKLFFFFEFLIKSLNLYSKININIMMLNLPMYKYIVVFPTVKVIIGRTIARNIYRLVRNIYILLFKIVPTVIEEIG